MWSKNQSQTATADSPSAAEALDHLSRADKVLAKMKGLDAMKKKAEAGADEALAGESAEKSKAKEAAPEAVKKPEPPAKKAYIVISTPPSEVFVDGKKVGQTPYTQMLSTADAPVVVELRSKGYKSKPVVIRPDGQRDQIFNLEREAVKAAPVAKPKSGRKRKKASSSAQPDKKPAKAAPKKKKADTVLEPW